MKTYKVTIRKESGQIIIKEYKSENIVQLMAFVIPQNEVFLVYRVEEV